MYLIFDFDGTLVDSFQAAIETFNYLADEFHYLKVDKAEVESLRDLTSMELIRRFQIPLYKIPQVLLQARKHIHQQMANLTPFLGLPETLASLHRKGMGLGILTSNSKENVETWLGFNGLAQYFNFIHTESSFFGKKRILKKILKNYHIDKTKAFYIGDETRDIEAAKQNNIYSVAVTWGFNSEKALLLCEPHFMVKTPEDILNIIQDGIA